MNHVVTVWNQIQSFGVDSQFPNAWNRGIASFWDRLPALALIKHIYRDFHELLYMLLLLILKMKRDTPETLKNVSHIDLFNKIIQLYRGLSCNLLDQVLKGRWEYKLEG